MACTGSPLSTPREAHGTHLETVVASELDSIIRLTVSTPHLNVVVVDGIEQFVTVLVRSVSYFGAEHLDDRRVVRTKHRLGGPLAFGNATEARRGCQGEGQG